MNSYTHWPNNVLDVNSPKKPVLHIIATTNVLCNWCQIEEPTPSPTTRSNINSTTHIQCVVVVTCCCRVITSQITAVLILLVHCGAKHIFTFEEKKD